MHPTSSVSGVPHCKKETEALQTGHPPAWPALSVSNGCVTKPTVALVDYHSAGHHASYLRLYSQILLEMGYRVAAFSPMGRDLTDHVAHQLPSLRPNFRSFPLEPPKRPASFWLRSTRMRVGQWRRLGKVIRMAEKSANIAVDLVFFLWLDELIEPVPKGLDWLVPWTFPYSWGGLTFQFKRFLLPGFHKRVRFFCRPEHFLRQRHCKGVAALDSDVVDQLRQLVPGCNCVHFPDITDTLVQGADTGLLAKIRQRARGRRIVASLGALDHRKGIPTLLEAARQAVKENWFFVILGRLYPGFAEPDLLRFLRFVASEPDHCFFHLELVPSEATLNLMIRDLVDVVYLAYKSFPFSSNLITKASYFHKPVIVSKGHLMGQLVEKYNLGLTIPEGDVQETIVAIHRLTEDTPPVFGFDRYNQDHGVAVLRQRIRELFRPIFENKFLGGATRAS